MATRIEHRNTQFPHRLRYAFFGQELRLRAAGNFLRPEGSVAIAIGNESNMLSVRRPARRDIVEVAVRKMKSIAALRRHDPQLMPLLSEIRRVNDALTVGRKVRPRLPGGFFVVDLGASAPGIAFIRQNPPVP